MRSGQADPAGMQSVEILDAAREIATKLAGLKAGNRKLYIARAAQAVEQFDAQQAKLQELAKAADRRAKAVISDAVAEIQGLLYLRWAGATASRTRPSRRSSRSRARTARTPT